MTVALFIGDAPHDVTGIVVRKSGVLKTVQEGWIRVGGSIRQFYAAIAIALSIYIAIGRGNSAGLVTVTSGLVTANVTGAVGVISYVWSRTAPDAQPWVINSPNAQSTTFSTNCDQGDSFTATFICTATDQAGQVIASTAVTVTNANIYYGGGYGGLGGGGHAYP